MNTKSLLFLLFFLSGAAGLSYEFLWTRMLAVGLGHEIVSMLAVVSAFFSGIALGAWVFARRVSRSTDPTRWYVGFELVIALWAVALLFIIPRVTPWVSALLGLEPSSQLSPVHAPLLSALPADARSRCCHRHFYYSASLRLPICHSDRGGERDLPPGRDHGLGSGGDGQ